MGCMDEPTERVVRVADSAVEFSARVPKIDHAQRVAGVVAAGDSEKSATTALQVYVDALTVGQAASALGRVRALNEAERRFIETWEAEAYRQQVAKA